jgi:hypothetical protein
MMSFCLYLVVCCLLALQNHHQHHNAVVEGWIHPQQQHAPPRFVSSFRNTAGNYVSNRNSMTVSMLRTTTKTTPRVISLQSRPMKNEDSIENNERVTSSSSSSRGVEEYRNTVTKVLSTFMQNTNDAAGTMKEVSSNERKVNGEDTMVVVGSAIDSIDFDTPKIVPTTSLETLAAALDYELTQKQWFVTGVVNPAYFSDEFEFQDPDVKLKGIEAYSRGVNRLFDQDISRADIISTVVNATTSTIDKPVITCTWRLSGGVNIAFGIKIKPYIVYTDFVVDPKTSLIVFQEDRFALPPWDILLRYGIKSIPSNANPIFMIQHTIQMYFQTNVGTLVRPIHEILSKVYMSLASLTPVFLFS